MQLRLISCLALFLTSTLCAAQVPVSFINDWRWEGPQAPLLWALDEGFYSAEGLQVIMEPGEGSLQAIPRVDSGEFDLGIADINSLIKFRDQNPESNIRAIYVIYNSPPFAIIGRPSLGVIGPSDLIGKTLGAPAADGAFAQWSALAEVYGINSADVRIQDVGFPVRESLLAEGSVDAITGFSFSSFINLQAQGLPTSDISLMLMSDFGLDLYGNVIIVNDEFSRSRPDAVSGFLRATTRGYQSAIANPSQAVQYVMARNPQANEADELRRLVMAIGHHIVTDEVREHGLGAIQMGRLERSIEQIAGSYGFSNRPTANEIFDEQFLPEAGRRSLVSPDAL